MSSRCLDGRDSSIPNLKSNGALVKSNDSVRTRRLLQLVVHLLAIQVHSAYLYIPWTFSKPGTRKIFLL